MQNSLPAGWLAFAGRELNPLDRYERFPSCYISSPFPEFILTLGSFELCGRKFFWKIDYYDRAMEHGSENPTDPEQTTRVMTVMLASEY